MISTLLPKEARDLLIETARRKDITEFRRRALLEEITERLKTQYPQYFRKDL